MFDQLLLIVCRLHPVLASLYNHYKWPYLGHVAEQLHQLLKGFPTLFGHRCFLELLQVGQLAYQFMDALVHLTHVLCF